MVNLGGYRIIDVMEITSKDVAAMQLGASSGIKTWGMKYINYGETLSLLQYHIYISIGCKNVCVYIYLGGTL